MPTYEYKCPKCDVKVESFHKTDEDKYFTCPNCYTKMVKGFGGGIGIHLKGSGFYETDYKGK